MAGVRWIKTKKTGAATHSPGAVTNKALAVIHLGRADEKTTAFHGPASALTTTQTHLLYSSTGQSYFYTKTCSACPWKDEAGWDPTTSNMQLRAASSANNSSSSSLVEQNSMEALLRAEWEKIGVAVPVVGTNPH